MYISERPLIFLCSGAAKTGNKKLSYRIATQLASMEFGDIGTLEDLSHQHSAQPAEQRKMIFINDCKSGCVNVLTHGFLPANYIFFDISPFRSNEAFDIDDYINSEVLPRLIEKWNTVIA